MHCIIIIMCSQLVKCLKSCVHDLHRLNANTRVQDATAQVANLVPAFMLGQLAEIPANHPGGGIEGQGGEYSFKKYMPK